MKKEVADIAASIVDRINKLESKILELHELTNKKSYKIIGYDMFKEVSVTLEEYSIAKEVFVQDILEYYINTLNLELDDEKIKLDEL